MYSVLLTAVLSMPAAAHEPMPGSYRQSAGCQGGQAGQRIVIVQSGCQGGMAYSQRAGCSGGTAYGAGCQGASAGYRQSAGCQGGSGGQARGGPIRRFFANRLDRSAERRGARQHARAHRFSSAVPMHGETLYYRETIYTERLRTFCG